MTREDPFVVACIPTYCEESTIARIVLAAQRYVHKVVVCDDGSKDMTADIAERLGAHVVRHDTNRGKGHALKTLFGEAMKFNADVVILLDGDGQHDPHEIPNLLEPILQLKADLVVGSRYANENPVEAPLYRRLGLRVLNYLHNKVNKLHVSDAECGFKALSRKALNAVCFFDHGGYGVDAEMVSLARKNGISIVEVPVDVKYKELGRTSKKTPLAHGGELIANLLRIVIEEHPLKYLGLPGALALLVGILAAVYMVFSFNSTNVLSVHAMVVSVGSTVTGLLLVVAGLILWGLQLVRSRIADLRLYTTSGGANEEAKQ
jgi:glycosyltransferase involved in cell wall biosynthesis